EARGITGGGDPSRNAGTTAETVTVTVAVATPPCPSEIVYWNVSVPVKPFAGVYWHCVAVQVAVPCAGVVDPVIVSVSPSESLSFARTLIVTGVDGEVDAVSSVAIGGASFVAVIEKTLVA